MSKDKIDASIGLAFSLKLLQHYGRRGILQAKVHHVPGVQGHCMASLHLDRGMVVSCYIDDKHGQRLPWDVEELCRIDTEKGPFEWIFQPHLSSPAPVSPSPMESSGNVSPPSEFADSMRPTVVATLHWEQLSNWTPEQKQILYNILMVIDGRRTIQEIKAHPTLSPQIVNEALRILLALHVIAISS